MAEKLTPANQREQDFRNELIDVLKDLDRTLGQIEISLRPIDVQLDNQTENQVRGVELHEQHIELMKKSMDISEKMMEGHSRLADAATKMEKGLEELTLTDILENDKCRILFSRSTQKHVIGHTIAMHAIDKKTNGMVMVYWSETEFKEMLRDIGMKIE